LLYRPPPTPVAAADVDMVTAASAGAGSGIEIPAADEQPPTTTTNETNTTATGLPLLDVKTNPELPSPARVRWMDAFSRVCAHLNQVTSMVVIIAVIIIRVEIKVTLA